MTKNKIEKLLAEIDYAQAIDYSGVLLKCHKMLTEINEQVEVIEEGEEPIEDDLIIGWAGRIGEIFEVDGDSFWTDINGGDWENPKSAMEHYEILQRNNKATLMLGNEEKEND